MEKFPDVIMKLTFGAEIETLDCLECDGRRYISCPECTEGEIECPECDGEGYVICPECEEGEIKCPECGGRGYVTCPECNGDYEIACPVCGDIADGWDVHSEHCGMEFASPAYNVTDYDGFLDDAYSIIQEMNFDSYSGNPTGMHIHVGVKDVFEDPRGVLMRLADVWEAVENVIVDDIACTSNCRYEYAQLWWDKTSYTNPKAKIEDGNLYFDRYATLNYAAYLEHGTVEFRLWNSPGQIQDVMTAVEVSTAVVVYAWLRSRDNRVIKEEQVMSFINKWGSYMRGLTYWKAA